MSLIGKLLSAFRSGDKRGAKIDDLAKRFGLQPQKGAQKRRKEAPQGKSFTLPPKEAVKGPQSWRLAFLAAVFIGGMVLAVAELGKKASVYRPPPIAAEPIRPDDRNKRERARIVDRNGQALAESVRTYALYLDLSLLDPDDHPEAAETIAAAFDDLSTEALRRKFRAGGTPRIKMPLTPIEAQRAHDLGIPGLYLRERSDRVYFAGNATSHLLGWTRRNDIGANSGEAGVEGGLNKNLTEAANQPVSLSIDLRMQLAVREILAAGVKRTAAKGGSAVVLDPDTGEVLAMTSLPDFDPHDRKIIARGGGADSPVFHRAVSGRYELGSVMKIVTWALALETGAGAMFDVYPPPKPFKVSGRTIRDDHKMGRLSFSMAFAKSSNIIAAQLALKSGRPAQHKLFEELGLHAAPSIALAEARKSAPIWTSPWRDAATASTAYGHGVALSPLQMGEIAATIIGDGKRVRATILRVDEKTVTTEPKQVIKPETSRKMRDLMRLAVTDGTGKNVDVPGLEVGGKTGTAVKPDQKGGYYRQRVISTFVAGFPMSRPKAVVVVMLDEPSVTVKGKARRSAFYTAAPVAREIIERIAPLLGVSPAPLKS